jgi:hypothetical protein
MANVGEKERESLVCKPPSRRQFLERSMVGDLAAGLELICSSSTRAGRAANPDMDSDHRKK